MDESALAGIRLKLDRADTHLRELGALVGPWIADPPYDLRGEIDAKGGKFVGYVVLKKTPPVEWSILVGDLAHNARSALDHLVWSLVPRNRRTIRTQFPILTDPDEFTCSVRLPAKKKRPGPLTGLAVDGAAFAAIEHVQPYNGAHGPEYHPLLVLRELSNEDKHRTILAQAIGVPSSDGPAKVEFINPRHIEDIANVWIKADMPLKDGAPLLGADIRITGCQPYMDVETDLPLSVAFGKPTIIVSGLAQLVEETRRVVEALAKIA